MAFLDIALNLNIDSILCPQYTRNISPLWTIDWVPISHIFKQNNCFMTE